MDKQQRALVFVSECGSITNGADYEPEDVALCNCLPFIKQQADSITIKNPGGGGKPRRTNDWRLAYMHTLTRSSIHMCERNVIQTLLNRKKVFHNEVFNISCFYFTALILHLSAITLILQQNMLMLQFCLLLILDYILHHFRYELVLGMSALRFNRPLHLLLIGTCICEHTGFWMCVYANRCCWWQCAQASWGLKASQLCHAHTQRQTKPCTHRLAPCSAFRAITVKQLLACQEKCCWWDRAKEGEKLKDKWSGPIDRWIDG